MSVVYLGRSFELHRIHSSFLFHDNYFTKLNNMPSGVDDFHVILSLVKS